jgi:hypothetical protein
MQSKMGFTSFNRRQLSATEGIVAILGPAD